MRVTLRILIFAGICISLFGCGVTVAATNVTDTTATLNGKIACSSGNPCTYYFRWGTLASGAYQAFSTPQNFDSSGHQQLISQNISGLVPGVVYIYQICGTANGTTTPVCTGPDQQTINSVFTTTAASGPTWSNGWGGYTSTNLPGATWRPFSDTSWVNTPLPSSPRLLSNSSTIIANMFNGSGGGDGSVRYLHPLTGPGQDYAHPYAFSNPASSPLYTISCVRNCNLPNQGGNQNLDGTTVRIPCGAHEADGTDHHLTVFDQAGNTEYDLYGIHDSQMGPDSNQPTLWADAYHHLLNCQGGKIYMELATSTPISGDGRLTCAGSAACTAQSSGIVRAPELTSGVINHALFGVDNSCNGTAVFPGLASNLCNGVNSNAPAIGQWLQLNLTPTQINAISGIADWQKILLIAMSKYGMWLGDQGSSGAFELMSDSPFTFYATTNPWIAWANREATLPNNNISWDGSQLALNLGGGLSTSFWTSNLRVVDPCVIQRTC